MSTKAKITYRHYKILEYLANFAKVLPEQHSYSTEHIFEFVDVVINVYILDNRNTEIFPDDFVQSMMEIKKRLKTIKKSLGASKRLAPLEGIAGFEIPLDISTSKEDEREATLYDFVDEIRDIYTSLHKVLSNFCENNPIELPKKLNEIFTTMTLNDIDQKLFSAFYVLQNAFFFRNFITMDKDQAAKGSTRGSQGRRIDEVKLEMFLSIPSIDIKINLKKNSKLFLSQLLELELGFPTVSEFVQDFIQGSSNKPLLDHFFEYVDLSDTFDLETFQIEDKDKKNLKILLSANGGIATLFKGVPGAGKTELAKSLASTLKAPLYILKHGRKKDDDSIPSRKMGMYIIQELFKNSKAIFLIDECEDLINSKENNVFRTSDENLKSYINEFLDANLCNLVFIANNTRDVDDSTMRRFNYILTFKEITSEHRELMISNLFAKEKEDFLSHEEIRNLAHSTSLNIGHYGIALKTTKKYSFENFDKKSFFLDIVTNHSKEFLGVGILPKKINQQYSLEGLNTDHNLFEVTTEISERYFAIMNSQSDSSVNIFLSGPPGAGKTEYVKYLAQKLQKKLIIKQASDLKSKYVGDSEKLIKQAFIEAQETNSILFIDEIDSMIFPRDMSSRSYEVSQVNEMLICMENFKGIFIAASNSIERIDQAALRRFLYKIKFDFLRPSGIAHFFELFFSQYLDNEDRGSINELLVGLNKLTPSDFNTVKRKIEFDPSVSLRKIIELLKVETKYKGEGEKKSIGL